MGQVVTQVFTELASQASLPIRAIATAIVVIIGIGLMLMPYEHGAVRFLKDNILKVVIGMAIAINAAAIVSTLAGG